MNTALPRPSVVGGQAGQAVAAIDQLFDCKEQGLILQSGKPLIAEIAEEDAEGAEKSSRNLRLSAGNSTSKTKSKAADRSVRPTLFE